MARTLPRLRTNLDFMPSPVPERPGLLIRDSYGYSDATLIIPPPLVNCLTLFDGESTETDLRAELARITGELQVGDLMGHLTDTLERSGFLENETYEQMREARRREFAEAPERAPAHAGSAYPDEAAALHEVLGAYMGNEPADAQSPMAIAAPHVSPEGGWMSYRAAYQQLPKDAGDRTFVILGTSHYGAPDRFGLTRKAFATPFGAAPANLDMVDFLAGRAAPAIDMEDYCHSVEHSIEFQVIFLQYLYGANVKILPILCGSHARSIYQGGMPEDNDDVRRFQEALGELAEREQDRLFWVLGIDMAHMGRRYQDPFEAEAGRGRMEEVASEDYARIGRVIEGDPAGFWDLVQQRQDDLKWCGSAPLYTFLRAVPGVRGALHRYEQWNIDPESVVTFAGLSFARTR